MNKKMIHSFRINRHILAVLLCLLALASGVSAQSRRQADRLGDKLVDINVGEITLEAIDFRDQTARMNVALDISNSLMPIKLKDFEYRLSLFNQQTIEGSYNGTMKIGGRKPSRINLPVVLNLRSIPGVVWSAFSNRGQVRYQLDAGFTVPLFIMNKRFDQSFAGEVPLKSLVDAASILRARRLNDVVPYRW